MKLKQSPEDFEVEEIPAYAPSGEGEHLYLWVEKRGRSTVEAARALAAHFGLSDRDISWAGLKDKQALTRQLICVPARVEAEVATFADPDVKILWSKRHRNKLKSGHLHGNKFTLRLREVADVGRVRAAFERLGPEGLPNFFGEQRFGREDDNARKGRLLLKGERVNANRFQRKLFLSAFQSLLFNRALKARVDSGTWTKALAGDVLKKHDTGGEFVCREPAVDQPRVDAFEVSPAGPMFGPKMTRAEGEAAAMEEKLLAQERVTLDDFAKNGRGETEGARRLYRVKVADADFTDEGDNTVRLRFSLPAGSYATVLVDALSGESRPSP